MKREAVNRRTFFKQTAGVALGAATASTALLGGLKVFGQEHKAGASETLNETMQMYADLRRALAKPIEKRKWGMVIDARKCIGCSACTVACIAENNLPPGVTYRVVKEAEDGEYPNIRRYFMPTNCMQCENPPCMDAANAVARGAMEKRPDGIVTVNYQKFKGKKVLAAAQKACPYTAFYYDEGGSYTDRTPAVQPYEQQTFSEYGVKLTRKMTKGLGRKCHFCVHRIESGVLPACVTTCTGQAMYFGDLNDGGGLVSQLIREQKTLRFEEARGTGPKVYYSDWDPQESCAKCHS